MRDNNKNDRKQTYKLHILRFPTKSDIILTKRESLILSRWEFADLLMRQGIMLTSILIARITEKFSVTRVTADSDILNAMEVFGKCRRVNRTYLGQLHLQDISADLTRIRNAMFKDQKIPNDKDLQALSKLHDTYTFQFNNLIDEIEPVILQPVTMQFALSTKQLIISSNDKTLK